MYFNESSGKVREIQHGILLFLIREGGFYMLSIIHVHDYSALNGY